MECRRRIRRTITRTTEVGIIMEDAGGEAVDGRMEEVEDGVAVEEMVVEEEDARVVTTVRHQLHKRQKL